MGAWSHGPLNNDDAVDFLADVTDAPRPRDDLLVVLGAAAAALDSGSAPATRQRSHHKRSPLLRSSTLRTASCGISGRKLASSRRGVRRSSGFADRCKALDSMDAQRDGASSRLLSDLVP